MLSFITPDLFDNNVQYHSDLSDQSALKIRVKISVLHYFSIFTENDENERLTVMGINYSKSSLTTITFSITL